MKRRAWLLAFVFYANVSLCAEGSGSLLVLHTQADFEKHLRSDDIVGPMTEAHKLLFAAIGWPGELAFASIGRADALLLNPRPTCSLFRRPTQARLASFLFSDTIAYSLAPRLYQRVDAQEIPQTYQNARHQLISMHQYFAENSTKTILVLSEASYGDMLDNQLSKINHKQKLVRYAADPNNSQAEMLYKLRTDFALITPAEIRYFQKQEPGATFRSYAIEGQNTVSTVHIMCNKTPVSAEFIANINQAISTVKEAHSMQQAYKNAYSDSEWALIEQFLQRK